jgi:hypothetical protein
MRSDFAAAGQLKLDCHSLTNAAATAGEKDAAVLTVQPLTTIEFLSIRHRPTARLRRERNGSPSNDDIRHMGARSLNSETSANLLIRCIFNLALLYGLKS